jgi:hypothetical protein
MRLFVLLTVISVVAAGAVSACSTRGDTESADVRLRVVAIGTLGTPPSDARHRRTPLPISVGGEL